MVVQLVVGSEALTLRTTADAAGDEQFLRRHVLPYALQGFEIGLVAGERRHVGDAAEEIAGAYGMTHYFVLLQDGFVVLGVFRGFVPIGATTGLLDEVFRALEVSLVARDDGFALRQARTSCTPGWRS